MNSNLNVKLLNFLLVLAFIVNLTFGARILGIVTTPSYSHQIVFRPLWRELSLRGHQLTVLTTDPMKDRSLKNLTEIDFHFSYKTFNEKMDMNEMSKLSTFGLLQHVIKAGYFFVEEQLEQPDVQKLLKNDTEKFDLVLIEPIFPAMTAFSEKFDCPLIQILSLDGLSYMYHAVGNPSHPVLNPEVLLQYSENLNFFQRLTSTLTMLFLRIYYYPNVLKTHQSLVNKYFGEHYPSLEDILGRTSMLFVNTDIIFHPIRPLLPNVIQFGGGSHLTKTKPLPKDLKKILDDSENGFIYFSLGSNVKSKNLPESTRKVILETLAELPYTVLWKFELEDLPGKSGNVFISKWFPQQDIFRHPKIKLFITQGGLQSTEEAVYNHIPMVGIPFVADQQSNVQRMVTKGLGLSLDHNTLEKESFKKTIFEVMENPKYRNRVKQLAELALDQPMTGTERAVWWTEYVIRHKGAKHLRSPALDLPDYQYLLLDVIGFCVIVISIVSYILFRFTKFLYFYLKKNYVESEKPKMQ